VIAIASSDVPTGRRMNHSEKCITPLPGGTDGPVCRTTGRSRGWCRA
jgi:hypothetical protein